MASGRESIARLAAYLDLQNITLVVQDWGGPIGLRLPMLVLARSAFHHSMNYPQRVNMATDSWRS